MLMSPTHASGTRPILIDLLSIFLERTMSVVGAFDLSVLDNLMGESHNCSQC